MTEAGAIPEDWRLESIGTLGVVGRGRVISHREIAKSSNPTYPVYSSQTSNDGVMGYLDTFDFEGDYITWTTDGANAGTVFYRNGRFNCTNVCGTIKVHSDDPRFVAMALSQIAPRHVSRQVGNPKLMNGVMKRVMVPLPPTIEEQRAIATALSDVDELLHTLDGLVEKKRNLKQAVMQQLLTGRTRLEQFAGVADWKRSTVGRVPADWVEYTLFELAGEAKERFDDGDWIEAQYLTKSGVRLIQTGNIGVGTFIDKSEKKFISQRSFDILGCKEIMEGDVLICRLADPVGRACLMPAIEDDRAITAVDVTIFRPVENIADRRFLVYLFSTEAWLAAISTRCGGSTRLRIARGELGKVSISLPPTKREQAAIAAIILNMDAEICALEAQRDKTKELKTAMMQQLVTGKTRLISREPVYV